MACFVSEAPTKLKYQPQQEEWYYCRPSCYYQQYCPIVIIELLLSSHSLSLLDCLPTAIVDCPRVTVEKCQMLAFMFAFDGGASAATAATHQLFGLVAIAEGVTINHLCSDWLG